MHSGGPASFEESLPASLRGDRRMTSRDSSSGGPFLVRAVVASLGPPDSDLLDVGNDYVVYAESPELGEYRIVPAPDIPFLYPADASSFYVISPRPASWKWGAGFWAPSEIADDPTFFDALTEGDQEATRDFAELRKCYGDVAPEVGAKMTTAWISAVEQGVLAQPSAAALNLGYRLNWFSPSWLAGSSIVRHSEDFDRAPATDTEALAARQYWTDVFAILDGR